MNETIIALAGYIGWMLLLLPVLLYFRIKALVTGQHRSSTFKPDGSDVSEFTVRLCRVHANAYEHFPIFGGLMLLFLAIDQTDISDGLALYLLAARWLQGITHLLSTSDMAVRIRLLFFIIQWAIAAYWLISLFYLLKTGMPLCARVD